MISMHLLRSARMITLKRTRCLAITVILLSASVISDMSYAAGRVFYDGFESGTIQPQWTDDAGSPLCPVVSTSVDGVAGPYAGTKMLSCNNTTSSSVFENLKLDTSNYTDELFIRTRVRVDQDMDRTTNSSKKILRFFYWDYVNLRYHDMFEIIRLGPGLNNESHPQYNVTSDTYWGDASGDNTAVSTSWHKVEYYIRHSTGTMKVWHDGILVRNDTGLNYEGVKWSPFFITSNFSDSHDGSNHVYFDEFEVFSDLGSGAIGQMSSATIAQGGSTDIAPPAAPVNLRIQ